MTYLIPTRYLYLNRADIAFWDAVYYLLAYKGWSAPDGCRRVETTNAELCAISGISERALTNLRALAVKGMPPYSLREDFGGEPYSYVLEHPAYAPTLRKHAIVKPKAYVEQGWLRCLFETRSRFPLAVINRFFSKPPARLVTVDELVWFSKHPERKKPPPKAEIYKALQGLQGLGLIEQVEADAYRLLRDQLRLPAQVVQVHTATPQSPREGQAIREAQAQDPQRAARALEIAQAGQFDLAFHFEEIFRDLGYVTGERALALLRHKATSHRRKPPGLNRWQHCWQQFQRELKTHSRRVASPKQTVQLERDEAQVITLNWSDTSQVDNIMWARVVLWLNTPDYSFYTFEAVIRVQVLVADTLITEADITYETAVWRRDLTRALKRARAIACRLIITPTAPLPRVGLSFSLEGALWEENREERG